MERHTRLSRAAVVLVTIALIAAIAAAVWFASPESPYVPSEDSGAALGTAAPAEDGTVADGYQPSGEGISDISTARNNPSGNYHLTQDITITSLHSDDKWDQAFSGTLDGAGHTITINAETKNTGCTDAGGLFIGVKAGATIKNMTIVVNSFHYGTSASDTANGGIIGGYASGDNITVDNVKVILNQDSNTMHHGTSTYNDVDTYMYSTTGDHSSIAFNLGGLFGKVEGGTTTIKNTTVYNSAGGKYGFSAWTWVSKPWLSNGESWINIGGFVGSVQKSGDKDGNLTLQNVKYDADDDAKISALAESGTDRNNYARLSPFLGVLNAGKLTVDNLIFNAGGTFTSMFYRDDTTTNEHNEGMYNGRGILIGYDVNKWLQTTGEGNGVSSRKDVYLRDAITGDSGTGLGNGDAHTSLLAGNNSWMDGFMSYPSEIEDASFTDDGKIAFALPNRSGDIAKAVRQINQNGTVTTVSDAQIAEQVTEGGGLTWIEAPVVAHGDDTSVSASLNKVSTGAYNVQNYDTVSSADDSAYLGSKVYDGTMVKTPTLNVGDATVNAWTADSTTADFGTKTFSYNADALSGYATATYNGGTYLVKDGTIYSPGTITVNGAAQPFDLDKDFVYEITPAPVTVTPNVPTDLYAGNSMPELTATAVDSGGSPVEGSIAWDDPDATLISGKNSYDWTWTPNSDNYQTVTGSIELEAFDRKIESLTVAGDFKKAYTAYEPFDPTGVKVIAHYTDGSSEQLDNDEYEFKVENGDKNRLIVANNTVTVSLKKGSGASTTITITVSKLAVDVPNAIQGLVYTGGEQTGVEASADGYYSLSGNTGTNAAAYTATATLTDPANTRWNTADPDDTTPKEIEWSIAKKDVDIMGGHTSKTYDGQEVDPTTLFTAQGVNDEALALTVAVDGGKTILGAGTYSVTASLAESVTNYTAEPVTIDYTVKKKGIQKPIDSVTPYTYNGTEQVVTIAENADYTVNGTTKATDAGNYSLTIALADKANTEWEGGTSDDITVTWSIKPATVTITGEDSSKTYDGEAVAPSSLFTAPNGVNDEGALQLEFAITVDDENSNEILNAGTYSVTASLAESVTNYTADPVTITFTIETIKVSGSVAFTSSAIYDGTEKVAEFTLTSPDVLIGDDQVTITYSVEDRTNVTEEEITATAVLPSGDNYAWADGITPVASMTIIKATPAVTVKLSDDMPGNLTVAATLDNAWLVRTDNTGVEGTLAWDKAGELLQQGAVEYGWTFVPTDSNNYNNVTGSLSITASEDTLQSITVKDGTYKTEYTAYEDFDPTGLVVIAHYASGTEVEVTSGFTFENDKALTDGQITVTLNGVSTTITVTVNKREIPLPTATEGLVFNGEEQNGIDQEWIEQYAEFVKVEGNSQRDAGDYRATVTLTKDTNYVTWKGGSTDAQTIDWSIAYVAIEVTVNAESKTVEYGTAYSWDPYDFFAVEVTNSDLFEVKLGVFDDDSITDISTANVGEYSEGIFASVTRKDGGALGEQDLASFKFSKDITQFAMKVIVTAKTVEVALDENVDFAAYDGEKLSKGELFGMFKTEMNIEDLAFEVDGVPYDEAEIVNAGEYTVKVVSANDNYDLTGTTEGVYKIAKATLTVTASVESEGLDTSDDLYTVPLSVKGVGVNGEEVSGTGVWASGQSLSEGTNNYKFVFTPDQEFAVNYEVYEGECEIANVAQATLTGVSVEIVATTEYVAFDAFDRSSIAVEALYGEDRKQVTDYTLTFSSGAEDRLVAGTGITVTVTYTDGDVTQYTEFTIDVAKRAVAKPVVDTTVFDATGETITLPIAESEYYTVTGNTGFGVGSYQATVSLVDADNTVWADGSVDDVSIAWTITEPVTSDEVIADILAMEKVTWQNAEEFLDLEARYNALDESEQTAEATAKLATLKAQYDALRNAAFGDIEAAHEVTAKSLGRALAAAAAGLSAAAIALAIAKRRSI